MRGPSPALVAYGCRYCALPLKRVLTFPNRRLPHFFTLSPSNLPNNLNLSHIFLTGNSLFFRMEVVWTFCVLLIISDGARCTLICDDLQLCTCPRTLDLQDQPVATSNMEEMRPTVSSSSLLIKRFWSGSGISKNKAMVEHLQHYGVISSKKVAEVMETVDRALFVPSGSPPYVDSPMSIGYNATISAPHMHATCLQLLEKNLQPGMHALDVGSGTGYLTACFAVMVGSQGRAVGVEHIPELVASSIKNIEKSAAASLLKEGSLVVHVGDGRQGWPEFAPYDAIHVGAAAPDIPQALIDQLKPGGRMVIPVGNIFQDLKVVDKDLDGSVRIHSETSVRYVPLTSREEQLRDY